MARVGELSDEENDPLLNLGQTSEESVIKSLIRGPSSLHSLINLSQHLLLWTYESSTQSRAQVTWAILLHLPVYDKSKN